MAKLHAKRNIRLALVVCSLSVAGCGDRGRPEGLGPSDQPSAPFQPGSAASTVRAHLDELLDKMQAESVNARTVDWDKLRTDVLGAAATASTIPAAYPAIEMALGALSDFESYYRSATGHLIGPDPDEPTCDVPTVTPRIGDDIGYIKVATFAGDGFAAQQYAQALQEQIRAADRPRLRGWIVDLRENHGGNPGAMTAGLGPIVGEGTYGWGIYRDREEKLEYRGGGIYVGGTLGLQVPAPYTLLRPDMKVAVLTSRNTTSAGEHIAVFLRGRRETRSFGTPTCGRQHLVWALQVSNGAVLGVKFATLADRSRQRYDGPIYPDDVIGDSAATVESAIAWLKGAS